MAPFAKPETVLKRSEELIAVGQSQAALQALYEIFTNRRFKQTPLTSLQPIMMKFVDLCVELRRGRTLKDGLVQYKNVSQNTDPASIEVVIKHFISISQQKVVQAQEKADEASGIKHNNDDPDSSKPTIDVEDLEESETPESMLLGAVSQDGDKERSDRELLTPWLKFLWEAFRTALDILRNNARLEGPYQQIAHQALEFCLRYQRKTEFRRLCDLLRTHLQNIARHAHHTHAINLNEPETLQRHLDTRFAQLNSAVELELWQEAFRSIEDIHNLLTMTKKSPKPSMMANYYEKLTKIFMVSDNNLFHAAAWNKYYQISRSSGMIKTEEEHERMANFVLLSCLSVPVISSSAPGTGNMNKNKTDFLLGDQESKSRVGRLTSLVGLNKTPTRSGLLKESLNRNLLRKVKPELRELYEILEVEFHPLSICEKIQPIISKISKNDKEMEKYVKPLHSVILTRLFQQLSQVYDSVKLDKIMDLVSKFEQPFNYNRNQIESFVLNAAKKGHLNIRVDHFEESITFIDDLFETETHPSSMTAQSSSSSSSAVAGVVGGSGGDLVKLQSTPSELVRTQLARISTCLETVSNLIDPTIQQEKERCRKESLARAVKLAEEEHENALARREILIKRRNLLTELANKKTIQEAEAKARKIREQQESEAKRIAEENDRRERERIRKEMENVRIEEAKKMAMSLKEKGGLKLTEEEYVNLDSEKLVQLQVEQLEREKKELSERLRVIHRRMDHTERAYRKEEIPLLAADYESQKANDLQTEKLARQTLLQLSKEKHLADMELKKRLQRIEPDYKEMRKLIESKRQSEFDSREKAAREKIEKEKNKRREEYKLKKQQEKLREEEEEKRRIQEEELRKVREEEEARMAEQRKLEQEAEAAKEAEKLAEIKARQAKLDEVARIQREREAAAEAKLEAQRLEREKSRSNLTPSSSFNRDSTSSPAAGGGAWRSSNGPTGAVAAARASPSERPPVIAPKAGGWRDRIKQKEAASSPAASTPPSSDPPSQSRTPALNGSSPAGSPSPANREAAPAANPYRPPVAAAGGWRAREDAKKTGGGAAPAPEANGQNEAPSSDGFIEVKKNAYRPPGARR